MVWLIVLTLPCKRLCEIIMCNNKNSWFQLIWRNTEYKKNAKLKLFNGICEPMTAHRIKIQIDGLMQACTIHTANALEILLSCTKPSKCSITLRRNFMHYLQLMTMNPLNSLWPSDAIWRQRHGSTLAQVMAWCRQAPSHYLNQCWLIISKAQ